MTLEIRAATPHDVPAIQALRRDRTAWLAEHGSDQWSEAPGALSTTEFVERITTAITAGQTWVTESDGQVIGTITIDNRADPGLWTAEELATAAIIHYMIVETHHAGHGLGTALLAHAEYVAADMGRDWLRLDAWTTNTDLHAYYIRAGFRLVRVADSAFPSAALFEKRIRPDNPAHIDVHDQVPQ